jgi:hypothetical protein
MLSKSHPKLSILILMLAFCLQSFPVAQVYAQQLPASDQPEQELQSQDDRKAEPKKGILMTDR